jgi:hypothetical protein
MLFFLLACGDEDVGPSNEDLEAVQAEVVDLQDQLEALQRELDLLEPAEGHERYEDAEAVAAVQNFDPFTDDEPNLQALWSNTDGGLWWLNQGEWYGDNRRDPAGSYPSHELIELYHETTECEEGMAFADCNATGGLKMYVNGPRITDNDWSEEGWLKAAARPYHTHTSGLYMVSFGVVSTVSDYGQLIPPSGLHLEPWGAHQALRIDGTANAGDNIRVELSDGATGLAVYSTGTAALSCEELGRECDESYPLYLRGGRIHLEDLQIERSVDDHRGVGILAYGAATLGVKRLIEYSWSSDEGLNAYCLFNTQVSSDTLVFLDAYGLHSRTFEPRLVDVWGPGDAPAECAGVQSITTTSGGTYGYGSPTATMAAMGGFRVVMVDAEGPIEPADFVEDYPVVRYELVEPI